MDTAGHTPDSSFLRYRTALILCSGCLRRGRRTPVPQMLSPRHTPASLCPECRTEHQRSRPANPGAAVARLSAAAPRRSVPFRRG